VVLVLLNTASAVISYLLKLEDETTKFYEKLRQKYPELNADFQFFSKENQKNKITVERVYYGVITDALEACFSFKDRMDSETYTFKMDIAENASLTEVLQEAIEMEEAIKKAYIDAASLSEGLMADVPKTLRTIAKKREDRIAKLKIRMISL
jgi:hemoglobin-like flavoprotein